MTQIEQATIQAAPAIQSATTEGATTITAYLEQRIGPVRPEPLSKIGRLLDSKVHGDGVRLVDPHREAGGRREDEVSPFLRQEARLIALARALRHLSTERLEDPAARSEAYAKAGLLDCTPTEDAQVLRRSRIYWKRIKPMVVVALESFAAGRGATGERVDG